MLDKFTVKFVWILIGCQYLDSFVKLLGKCA